VTEHRWHLPASDAARKLILIGLAGAGVLIALYAAALAVTGDGVRAGTTVNGVNIGGLSREEAVAALDDSVGVLATKPLKVRSGQQQQLLVAQVRSQAELTVRLSAGERRLWGQCTCLPLFRQAMP
jgi:hypothetical protein